MTAVIPTLLLMVELLDVSSITSLDLYGVIASRRDTISTNIGGSAF
jgi:hypothetical protein